MVHSILNIEDRAGETIGGDNVDVERCKEVINVKAHDRDQVDASCLRV